MENTEETKELRITATSTDNQHVYLLTFNAATKQGMLGDIGDGDKTGDYPDAVLEAFSALKNDETEQAKSILEQAGYKVEQTENIEAGIGGQDIEVVPFQPNYGN